MNTADIILTVIIILIMVGAVMLWLHRRKKGKDCTGNCGSCAQNGFCVHSENITDSKRRDENA